MITRDVLKLHSCTARAILRTFKTSLNHINHEMHSRSYDFLYKGFLNRRLSWLGMGLLGAGGRGFNSPLDQHTRSLNN